MISFGTGGFRGVIGEDFNKENVQKITQGLSNTAIENGWKDIPVVVGYDRRFMSDFFAEWVAEVFAGNGIKVLLTDTDVPTPLVMSATKALKHELGVMITASHNPYIFNGIKVFLKDGVDADVVFTSALEKVINSCGEPQTMPLERAIEKGLVEKFSYLDRYLDDIYSLLDPTIKGSKVKILYDNLCGVGVVGLKPLAKRAGLENFVVLNEKHDAFFNFVPPNPIVESMEGLKTQLIEGSFDFAIATDSDGDRLGVLDEQGNIVSNNDILACLYYYLVKYRGQKGDVVKNCATSVILDMLAEKLGFTCHEVDVGFKNISAKIRECDALIGGESSGGLTVRNYIYGKDSVFSSSLFIEMQIKMGKPVSQIVKEVREFAGYDFYCEEDSIRISGLSVFEKIAFEGVGFIGADRLNAFNRNVKYYFKNGGWALFRASGTEPLLRIFAEMPTQNETVKTIESMKKLIQQLDSQL